MSERHTSETETDKREAPPASAFFETFTAYQNTFALRTALELDLFTAIAKGADTIESLSQHCNAAPRGIRSLCNHLVVREVLDKDGERYSLSEAAATFLDRGSAEFVGDGIDFLTSETLLQSFFSLTDAVRRGGTAVPEGGTTSSANPAWVTFARVMERPSRPIAKGLADAIDDLGPCRKVLDVAAGHGRYGIEIASRHPEAQVCALDWPQVLDVARDTARLEAMEDRLHLVPGDAFAIDWGSNYDLVLLVNYLHHYSLDDCVRLLQKARAATRRGGRVVALEAPVQKDRVTPPEAARFSLVMLATTPDGDAYTFEEYRTAFERAGLDDVQFRALPGNIHHAILGTP